MILSSSLFAYLSMSWSTVLTLSGRYIMALCAVGLYYSHSCWGSPSVAMRDSHTVMQIAQSVFVMLSASLSHFSALFKTHESRFNFYWVPWDWHTDAWLMQLMGIMMITVQYQASSSSYRETGGKSSESLSSLNTLIFLKINILWLIFHYIYPSAVADHLQF